MSPSFPYYKANRVLPGSKPRRSLVPQLYFVPYNFRSVGHLHWKVAWGIYAELRIKEFNCEKHHDSSADIYFLVFPSGI